MSQNVARLKELLFDDESRELADLARRVEHISAQDIKGHDELRAVLDDILSRIGDGERMSNSVAVVLSDALRKAEIHNHLDLSSSIAPLVVTTIKTELRNSQDEMVEALYPLTGRLVKSYVASAMKDLADDLNRRIDQTRVMMRVRSLVTGRSVAELALADSQDFRIKDIYLIRRGTGELIARWPDAEVKGREHAMSGVLAAINEFTNEALAAEQGSLQHIDLGDECAYLRASPKYLLAAVCCGTAPKHIRRLIDETFLSAIEEQHDRLQSPSVIAVKAGVADLGNNLVERVDEEKARLARPIGIGLVKFIALLILLPLLGWFAYGWYSEVMAARVQSAASTLLAREPAMRGYLTEIDVTARGESLTISGLAPSQEAKGYVVRRLQKHLPDTRVVDRLTVVPGAGLKPLTDLSPDVEQIKADLARMELAANRNTAVDNAERGAASLALAKQDLARAAERSRDQVQASAYREALRRLNGAASSLARSLAVLQAAEVFGDTRDLRSSFAGIVAELSGVASDIGRATALPGGGATKVKATTVTEAQRPPTVRDAVTSARAAAERVAALAAAASLVAMAPEPPATAPAPPPLPAPAEPTAREKLEAAARAKAIFFSGGADYYDSSASAKTLADLAPLITQAGILVRIVGYTDESGGQSINSPLAEQRAVRVRDDLIALGVKADLLAAIGRQDRLEISSIVGSGSPNRRVEFHIGFDGEKR